MRNKFKKILLGTTLIAAITPELSWADEAGLNIAQASTVNNQRVASTSAASSRKTDIIWSNLMQYPIAGNKKNSTVGRGFGDPWNKYAWSMKDSLGGMLVGTKNAFYDALQYASPSGAVKTCVDNDIYRVTGIHEPLACMELFASPAAVDFGAAASVAANTRFAEIWRFDYALKSWSRVLEDPYSQGFRVMEIHNNKIYVGSDLGAFITGVDLYQGRPGAWNFPGSQLLASTDGKIFNAISSCVNGACTSASGLDNPYGLIGSNPNYTGAINTSIRALASFNGKLYVGTFNATGGQLWAYDDVNNSWALVPIPGITGVNPYKPAIMELRVYKDKLYIGIGGPSGNNYLYSYDGTSAVLVAGQPSLPNSTVGVIKLFASSNGLLYVGNTDLTMGFSLYSYDGTNFNSITLDGFGNANNAYAWSMADFNGRLYLGTFNQDFTSDPTVASAQLWYLEGQVGWQKAPLPKDFGPYNYGIRNMEIGNNQLFLGTASNMLAPDAIPGFDSFKPGTEVWTIR